MLTTLILFQEHLYMHAWSTGVFRKDRLYEVSPVAVLCATDMYATASAPIPTICCQHTWGWYCFLP